MLLFNNWFAKGKNISDKSNAIAIATDTPINDSDRKYLKIFDRAAPLVFRIPILFICV
jgi:hypothetical protein